MHITVTEKKRYERSAKRCIEKIKDLETFEESKQRRQLVEIHISMEFHKTHSVQP